MLTSTANFVQEERGGIAPTEDQDARGQGRKSTVSGIKRAHDSSETISVYHNNLEQQEVLGVAGKSQRLTRSESERIEILEEGVGSSYEKS